MSSVILPDVNSQVLLKKEIEKLLRNKKAVVLCKELGIHPTALSQFMKGRRLLLRSAASKYFKNKIEPTAWNVIEEKFLVEETGLDYAMAVPGLVPLYSENKDFPEMTPDQ